MSYRARPVESRFVLCWARLLGAALIIASGFAHADEVEFNRDIRPILADRCFQCHGPDPSSREADLRLDTLDGATHELAGGGKAVVPGQPGQSVILKRMLSDDKSYRMPPVDSKIQVTDSEIELIEQWIEQGAMYEKHWAFQPLPDEVPVPVASNDGWAHSALDKFLLARLEAEGLEPSTPAKKSTWLRRVSYDLIGLPPTADELNQFLNDHSPDAFEKVVDRLLASSHFGQRMAVPWLDAARYADSYGYQADLLSPTWPWRDWVVRALNDNLPYDQFLTWQIAGDLLPNATREQRLATAFNRLHRMTNEGGSIAEEFRTEYVADRAQTFGTAVLGLTVECARCHDHKFDPISQREFYQLTAFFDNIDEWGTYHDSSRVPTPSLLLPTPEQEKRLRELEAKEESAAAAFQHVVENSGPRLKEWLAQVDAEARIPGLEGLYPLDAIGKENSIVNSANPKLPGTTSPANELVNGRTGKGIRLAGDEPLSLPDVCGGLHPHETFSVAMWAKFPKSSREGVIFHRSGGSDVGNHGTELSLKDGRLFFAMIRYWPGNAIAVQSQNAVERNEWVHIAVTYDSTMTANGMHIYVNGARSDEIVRNNLYKMPGQEGDGITFGSRYRDRSIQGLVLDEIYAFNRNLVAIEVAQLHGKHALQDALRERRASKLRDYYLANFDAKVAEAATNLREARAQLLEYRSSFLEVPVMEETTSPRDTYLLARGAYDAPRVEETRVLPGVPMVLGEMAEDLPKNRLGLAKWLTDPHHPLTARVVVNRTWQLFFGQGLVSSANDFGIQGTPPTHPELLDWLARDFIASDWDYKRLCKQIVLSSTYRQSSIADQTRRDIDPRNLLHARGPASRLSAEMLRDTVLAASGLLNDTVGGPPVSPYQPAGLWRESNLMTPAYQQSVGRALYRRSLYTVVKRTTPMPNMVAFDAATRDVCTVNRAETNTPIQALVLLNDVQFVEACRVLGERMLIDGGTTDERQVRFAFVHLTGRYPKKQELNLLVELYGQQRELFAEDLSSAQELLALGDSDAPADLPPAKLAAATVVAQAILNLDATVWKR